MKKSGEEKSDAKAAPSGLAALRPGFAFTPEDDARFALGFPHVREVWDPPPGEEGGVSARAYVEKPSLAPRLRWPRAAANAAVRVWGMPQVWENAIDTRVLNRQAADVLRHAEPIVPEEATALIERRLERDTPGLTERAVENFVLLLEALVGPEVVAEAIVARLESFEPEMLLAEWSLPPMVTWQLGYVLLRLPAASAEAKRARLRRCLDGALEFRPWLRRRGFAGAGSSHARSLHCVLNGAAGAEDTDRTLRWYAHVTDDPVLVRMRVHLNRLAYVPDARLVFLAGEEILDRYAKDWRKLAGEDDQRWFVDQHARIRAPQATRMLLDMAVESAAKDAALAALAPAREWIAPVVEEAAKSDLPRAAAAKRLLKSWSEGR